MTDQSKPVRVRFAPSPTGELHIGGARTAIYNWAFARAMGGTFILRIEDTDPERSTEENKQVILRSMKWLGLDWDEGPEVGGEFGPYLQTERFDTYKAALEKLKEKGAVYPCFCTQEEIAAKRAEAEKAEGGSSGYDRTCRGISPEEAQRRIDAGEPHVWRLKVPENHGPIEFDDAVYGHMSFPADVMDDMILVRTDGTPTYNFAVVCDDANMQISHVVRGDDHLSNTPRQILIYEALGYDIPVFAHLSMILGADGRKLSKRRNATSVEQYKEMGYLPDTLVNFLALLGWSLDGETTIIPRDVLCREFSLDRITRKDAILDETKLDWMNGEYIKAMEPEEFYQKALPYMKETLKRDYDFRKIAAMVQTRIETFAEIPEMVAFFGEVPEYDNSMYRHKKMKTTEETSCQVLREVLPILEKQEDFGNDALFETLSEYMKEKEYKTNFVMWPIRTAVSGKQMTPAGATGIMEIIGKEESLGRIRAAIEKLSES